MRKENLQEATQRALIEGYKNLKENKSKKVEAKLEDIQMEIYEMIQTARNVDKQDKETNIKETIYAMKLDYPEIDEKELSDYVTKKADEIYAGDYDEKMESKQRDFKAEFLALPEKEQEKYKKCIPPLRRGLSNVEAETIAKERGLDAGILWWVTNIGQLTNFKESKKLEAYNYNWRDDIDEVENTEENDELVYAFAENLMNTDPDYAEYDDPWEIISNIISIWKINKRSRLYDYLIKWYGSEEEMKKHVRSFYETNDAIYFETGTGYSIFDADLLGGNADGRTADEFGRFVANGGVKEESKKVESSRVNESNDVNNDINFEELYKDVSEFSNEISIDDIKGAYNKLVDLKNQFNLSGKINVLGNFGFGIDVDKETAKRLYDEIDWYNKKYSVIIDETDFDKDIVCIAKECADAGQFGQIALDNVTNQAGYNDFARLEVTYNEI